MGVSVKSCTNQGLTKGFNITNRFLLGFIFSAELFLVSPMAVADQKLHPNYHRTETHFKNSMTNLGSLSIPIQWWRLWTPHASRAASTTWLRVSGRRPSPNRLWLGLYGLSEGCADEAQSWVIGRFSAPMPVMGRTGVRNWGQGCGGRLGFTFRTGRPKCR